MQRVSGLAPSMEEQVTVLKFDSNPFFLGGGSIFFNIVFQKEAYCEKWLPPQRVHQARTIRKIKGEPQFDPEKKLIHSKAICHQHFIKSASLDPLELVEML